MLARGSPTPLYRQFKDRLIRDIEEGTLRPHSQLPSEREWVKSLGVSRITVRQALSELVQLGYLHSVPGKGFFVADRRQGRELNAFLSFTAAAEARGEVATSKVLQARLVRAQAALAHDLGIPPGAEVVLLKRLRLASGAPMMVQEVRLPHARCPGLLEKDLSRLSLFALLREAYGIRLTRAETTISARIADKHERRLLALETPGVVLVAEQLSYAADGQPVERAVSVMHPERHPLSLVQHDRGRSLGVI
jgi:GntR family transcriptional regulator